jgi:hypothetical protein
MVESKMLPLVPPYLTSSGLRVPGLVRFETQETVLQVPVALGLARHRGRIPSARGSALSDSKARRLVCTHHNNCFLPTAYFC